MKDISALIEDMQRTANKERELMREPSKWVVVRHRGAATGQKNIISVEISIVRENNIHGRRSWGWFEPNQKMIVFSGEAHRSLVNYVNEQADTMCAALNKKEGWQ